MNTPPAFLNAERETRSFFWFMTLVLAGMTVWALYSTPALQQPFIAIPLLLVMALHILLHWNVSRFVGQSGRMIGYMLVQGALATALVYLARDPGLVFAASMALVGEIIGAYGLSWRGLLSSLFYLLLPLGVYYWTTGSRESPWGLLIMIPMVVFVVIYVELYSRQANANERARELFAELEEANRQLSEYSAQVEDLTIAAERQRMARELHDTLSQGLAGLILQLEAADAYLTQDRPDKARRIVQQTMEGARATLTAARSAIDDLRANNVADLEEALRREAGRFTRTSKIPCMLDLSIPPDLPSVTADSLLRIAGEALANVARHAAAAQAGIRLAQEDGALVLEIRDDGVGFDPAAVPAGHYGLLGMRERARLVGGALEIESAPGQGAVLRVRIPEP